MLTGSTATPLAAMVAAQPTWTYSGPAAPTAAQAEDESLVSKTKVSVSVIT